MSKVSIILPVFDAERFLALAVASLLVQSHRDVAIIAIDDGSSDASRTILEAAAEFDPRVSVLSRPNRGLIATLNEGLDLADSEYVARMDADDISYPHRIASQLESFAGDDALGLLGTNFDTLVTADRVEPAGPPVLTRPGERAVMGRFVTSLRHPTVMFRRSRLEGARLFYDEAYPCAEDFDLFRRLAEQSRIAETAQPHLAYRLHEGSVSVRRIAQMVSTHLMILSENLHRHYPAAAQTGFEAIGTAVLPETVRAAGETIRILDGLAAAQPEAEREAFETGVINTFYFLYSHICRSRRFDLAKLFVDHARRWHSIRRRERIFLNATDTMPVGPAFAFFEKSALLQRHLRARAAGRVIPGLDRIAGLARKIEAAACLDRDVPHAA